MDNTLKTALGIGLLLVAIVVGNAIGKNTVNYVAGEKDVEVTDTDMLAYDEAFMESCAITDSYRPYCQCTLDGLHEAMTNEELYEMSLEYLKTETFTPEVNAISDKCLEEITDEI